MNHPGAVIPDPIATNSPPLRVPIPPLENGDRLTRPEFERRYEAMPKGKKWELIEGVVYRASPVNAKYHGNPHFFLGGWMSRYCEATPGVLGSTEPTVRLDIDNVPQPDLVLYIDPACNGQLRWESEGYLAGAPELVAEIASSSISIDLGDKFNAYRRNGVKEYIVWRVHDRAIDWFKLQDGQYSILPETQGIYRSEVFPGLWLDNEAALANMLPRMQEVLQQGLDTPEHQAFVSRLQGSKL